MDATTLIAQAHGMGLTLAVKDGMIYPSGPITTEARALLAQMRPLKQAIIEALTQSSWDTLEHELTPEPTTADLTLFVGAIVDNDALAILQSRCNDLGWSLHTRPSAEKWYVSGIAAQRDFGKIIVGAPENEGNYHYTIRPGTPLYHRTNDINTYKAWLWSKIQDDDQADDTVVNALFEVVNGAWVGCDVYVDGPNADGVVAAAGWLMNQYKGKALPILRKGVDHA